MNRFFKQPALLSFLLLACACAPLPVPSHDGSGAGGGTDPASLRYLSSWRKSGTVTLTDGIFREPAAPGSAAEFVVRLSDWRVFGLAVGREIGAVILVTQAGGTGSFYDLALLTRDGDRWSNSDLLSLGDRVVIHSLAIRSGEIHVDMTAHAPQDPSCCPTQRVTRRFAVEGGRLAERLPPPP